MNTSQYHPLLLILVGLTFWACRSDAPAASAEAVEFELQGNVAYVRLTGEPDRLNPLLTTNGYALQVSELLLQPLMVQNPDNYELEPLLATGRAQISTITEGPYAGGTNYAFEIREAAKWDDGSPVTGEDVAFTFKMLFNPKVSADAYRPYYNMVKDVQVNQDNPRRFTVITDRPYILSEAAISTLNIYPKHIYDPNNLLAGVPLTDLSDPEKASQLAEDAPNLTQFAEQFMEPGFSRDPALVQGSGFYRLASWESGEQIILERKEAWWAKALNETSRRLSAGPERIVFKIIQDANTAANAVRSELVDVCPDLDSKEFQELRKNERLQRKYQFADPLSNRLYFVGINTHSPKLSDKRVRRALAHTVDVPSIINNLYDSLATQIVSPVHPDKPYYADNLPPIEYNLEKATQLLTEAGWTDTNNNGTVDKIIDGQRTEMELQLVLPSVSIFANNLALVLQENARQVGIGITIDGLEVRAMFVEHVIPGKYDLYSGAIGNDPVPDDFYQLWHTNSWSKVSGGTNRVFFGDSESDALIERIRITLDPTKRLALYQEFQELIYEEQPMIFLFTPKARLALSKRFDAEATIIAPGFKVNEFVKSDLQPN